MSHTVLVTGCTGLVGRGIARFLLDDGYAVLGTSRRPLRSRHARFTPLRYDLADTAPEKTLGEALRAADAVIHNAALLPEKAFTARLPEGAMVQVNVMGSHRLLQAAATAGAGKPFLFISGTAVLSETGADLDEQAPYAPRNEYLASKIAGEILCRQFALQGRLRTAILRIRAPYGCGGGAKAVIPRFLEAARAGRDLEFWGTGTRRQAFTFAEDVGLACALCIERGAQGFFNLRGGPAVSMAELAEQVLSLFPGSPSRAVPSGEPDPQEGTGVPCFGARAERELGFSPRHDLRSGLRKAAEALASGGGLDFAGLEDIP